MPSAAATHAVASTILGASKRACSRSAAGRLRTSSSDARTSRALMRVAMDRASRSVREVLDGLPEMIRTELIATFSARNPTLKYVRRHYNRHGGGGHC